MAEPVSLPILILIGGGFLTAFTGYWLHRLFLEAIGFGAGAGILWLLLQWNVIQLGETNTVVLTALFLIMAGVIGSFIAKQLERLFISFLGSIAGSILGSMIFSTENLLFSPKIAVASLFSGILAWKLFSYAVKVITAILGAYSVTLGYILFITPGTTLSENLITSTPLLPFAVITLTGLGVQIGVLHPLTWIDHLTDDEDEDSEDDAD